MCLYFVAEHAEDEYNIACLLFVFVAVSIPKLARHELSVFRAPLEGTLKFFFSSTI
jgi:NCK-associated protein 1